MAAWAVWGIAGCRVPWWADGEITAAMPTAEAMPATARPAMATVRVPAWRRRAARRGSAAPGVGPPDALGTAGQLHFVSCFCQVFRWHNDQQMSLRLQYCS